MRIGKIFALPVRTCIDYELNGNPIRQVDRQACDADVVSTRHDARGRHVGHVVRTKTGVEVLVMERRKPDEDWTGETLWSDRRTRGWSWGRPDPSDRQTIPGTLLARSAVLESLRGRASLKDEVRDAEGNVTEAGLRAPQVGAVHGALSHWKGSEDLATVVLPTGTGKTETMLTLFAWERFGLLLVVVPTDALRTQIAGKFQTMGLLGLFGVLAEGALLPVVGIVEHAFGSADEASDLMRRCNVVVATMAVLDACSPDARDRIADLCPYLFIDEAHHGAARTWQEFRTLFLKRPRNRALQFTATPYREDGRLVDGRVVFSYPLRKARAAGYFSEISLLPVFSWNEDTADEDIAEAALTQLDKDEAAGFEHVVMARTSSIARATAVAAIYQRLAPHRCPVLVHSQVRTVARREALDGLASGAVRVVVCVDMLGEGFDFPRLKIAALHDVHKSLPVTIQFTGRFTRAMPRLGAATVVANMANRSMQDSLADLYAEDADWNELLTTKSEEAVSRHIGRGTFIAGFTGPEAAIPLRTMRPKIGAVIYRTGCKGWTPARALDALPLAVSLFDGPRHNRTNNTFLFVTKEEEAIAWGDAKQAVNVQYHLYVLHWNRDLGLLFVNSSNTDSQHPALAKAAVGDDAEVVKGENVFRAFHGINRLVLQNVGLNHAIGRAVRFSMHSGSDVGALWSEVTQGTKTRSNIFGSGFENGAKVTLGCSRKGRFWTFAVADDLSEWLSWCASVGRKVLDASVKPDGILKHALSAQTVNERPPGIPLSVEWSDEILKRSERVVRLEVGQFVVPFWDTDLSPSTRTEMGPLRFRLTAAAPGGDVWVDYEVSFTSGKVRYVPLSGPPIRLRTSKGTQAMTEWLEENPPWIFFTDGAVLHGDELLTPALGTARSPYSADRIERWDWTGTDIKAESQTEARIPISIQFRVIQELLARPSATAFDVIFDDDGTGEVADIVAVRDATDSLHVHLYHCKYSGEREPGARVGDLYEVCGQAQRSIRWSMDPEGMFRRLLLRENHRVRQGRPTRFDKGDARKLEALKRKARFKKPTFHVHVVQPGLSASRAGENQLELLAATEVYTQETFQMALNVIGSA